ncbi:MAG: 4-hydroxy-3-methylbut-2-enyl diphosphate reductase [Bacteroidota bacterium]
MNITIDTQSGFCFGVVNAIRAAEKELKSSDSLLCLGDIVHNNAEVNRLKEKGLEIIEHEQLHTAGHQKVLIRAHGEPPETYQKAKENHITLIDATCPVVLKLQERIRKGYEEIKSIGGQIVIYGKEGHAEVNGLVGQTNNEAIIINHPDDISKIDFNRPIRLYSQTTQSIDGFKHIVELIHEQIIAKGKETRQFTAIDSICRQVSHRAPHLREFAQLYQVIIFVSGKKSSNGLALFAECKKANPLSYLISDIDDIESKWFKDIDTVGICGATSTPMWLMEKVAQHLHIMTSKKQ